MTFTLDTEVARVLQAALEKNGPPPAPPAGDVQTRRVTLDAMLEYFNNQAQPPADDVEIFDREVTTADGATLPARWYRRPSGDTGAAALYLHGGGMIVGSVPAFDGPVSRYVARTALAGPVRSCACPGTRPSSPMRPVCWMSATGTSFTGRAAVIPMVCRH